MFKHTLDFVPYDPTFLEQLFAFRHQPSTLAHNPIDPISPEEFAKRCEAISSDLNQVEKEERFRWYLKSNGELVGHIGFMNNLKMKTAEIGYVIAEKHHGRGLGTKAVGEFTRKVFSETKIRKLTALVHDKNIGSIRVLEKSGYRREGLLREQFLIKNEPANEIAFGLLRREWSDSQTSNS